MDNISQVKERLLERVNSGGVPPPPASLHVNMKSPQPNQSTITQLDPSLLDAMKNPLLDSIPNANSSKPKPPVPPYAMKGDSVLGNSEASTRRSSMSNVQQTREQPTIPHPMPFSDLDDPLLAEDIPDIPDFSTYDANDLSQESSNPGLDNQFSPGGGVDPSNEEDATTNVKVRIIAGVVIALILIFFILTWIGKTFIQGSDKDTASSQVIQADSSSQSTQNLTNQDQYNDIKQDIPGIVVSNSQINYSSEIYTDQLQITKHIQLQDGNAYCVFAGQLIHYGVEVSFMVSPEIYNKYSSGDIIDVSYSICQFGENIYCTDVEVMEG